MDLIFDLKRRLPESVPEFYRRRNKIEDVSVALVSQLYNDIPVRMVLDDRRVKVATGVVVSAQGIRARVVCLFSVVPV